MYNTGILSVFWSLPFTCIAISTIASSEVDISDNITEEIYATDITLNCSFNLRNTDKFGSISLIAQNVSDTFIEIAGAFGAEDPQLTPFGEYLFGKETILLKKKNSFVLTITNLTCRHERLYKCILEVRRDGGSKLTQVKSDTMSISVTVHPSKLKISSAMLQHDFPKSQSVAQMTEDDIQEMTFNEGQNITFICDADIGRPKGRFVWQKISFDDSKVNYSTTTTDIMQESCSYNGTSNLTIQLTATDNKAKIRCIVKSDVSRMEVFEESEPLDIHYKVRQPSISAPTTEFVFFEGDSIELECEADGNPKPQYAWIKGNNTNETFAYSEKLVIKGASIDDTGIYTCEAHNSVDDIIYKKYISEYIHIEKHTATPVRLDILLPIVSGVIFLAVVMATLKACNKICIYRSGEGKPKGKKASRILNSIHDNSSFTPDSDNCLLGKKEEDKVKLQKYITKNTSSSLMEHCAATNPGYTSNQETHIDCNTMDNSKCILEDEKKCKVKQEKEENEICNTANQTNNKAVSYAYVTVSPDYHTEKDKNMELQDMLKPPTIDEQNKLSTTENSCDNSPDHYASPVLGIYDELHDNRHKTDNGEKFDRMIELKRLHKERNEFIEKNTSIEHQDSTMFNCHASPLEKSKPSGYESVVIEEDLPVLSSEGSKSVYGDIEIVRQHNKEYFQHQKEEERKLNKSPISTQPVEYAQVNETTKLKNKKKQNDTDQEAVDTSAEIHKRIQVVSEERHAKSDEDDDHLDNKKIISNENSDVETNSAVKDNHTICNINSTFENASVSSKGDTIKVAMVSPTIRSLGSSENYQQNETTKAETKDRMNSSHKVDDDESYNTTRSTANSEDNKQKENIIVEKQQGTNGISGRTVDNASYFDTTIHLNKQQTNGDPESPITNVQNGAYTNPAFEIEDIQNEDAIFPTFRSTDGLQNDGEINQNNDTQPKNDYENVGSTDHPDTSNGDTTH